MTTTASAPPASGTRGGGLTRARILDAATALFSANGIRATSADRIIEQTGLTKVTFYRHFRSKTDLVVAYLESQAAGERAALEAVRVSGDAEASLRALAALIGDSACRPGFRGCPFINAAAEFPDTADPVRVVVDDHRRWTLGYFRELAADAGAVDADAAAGRIMMLRDGAMVNGYLGDPERIAATLTAASLAVVGIQATGKSK